MNNITRAKAITIYDRICAHYNITRPRFAHYFEYHYGENTIFSKMVKQGEEELLAGHTDGHYAQWLSKVTAKSEKDWITICKLVHGK